MLEKKTLTELRTIAQGLGVTEIFSKSKAHLLQGIEQKHKDLIPVEKIIIPIEYKTLPSGKMSDKEQLMDLLQPYIKRGLKVVIEEETWRFSFGRKSDSGTLRMPLRIALKKAQEILS